MTQTIVINWTVFGLTLAGLALFSVLYALLTRWMSIKDVEGQTAWMVVVGVTVTVVALVYTFGLLVIVMTLAAFAASGWAMVVEYVTRVHGIRSADLQKSAELNKELLHDIQATGREEPL